MNRYIATFHTHLSALLTSRTLQSRGIAARMAPVPRSLSSSCGTCVRYTAATPLTEMMHADYDAIYEAADGKYHELQKNQDT